jgi:site-specific DNA-methyltransferase (adenine-specific)
MNRLYYGDNLKILRDYIPSDSVDLIYLDPPFNSKANYNIIFREENGTSPDSQIKAFSDFWDWDEETQRTFDELMNNSKYPEELKKLISALDTVLGKSDLFAYLVMLSIRLVELRRVLKNTGSIYLHCDQTASHYIKIVLDSIFGRNNFVNEIIWSYQRWTNASKSFQAMHDTILFYAKQNKKQTFNILQEPYSAQSKHKARRTSVTENGRVVSQSYTEETSRMKSMRDVWEISYLNSQAKERLGYPTQKPLSLLERIIKASSNEGDLVLDPFCGCGTALDAAEKLHRNWIGIDITHIAIRVIKKRLKERYPDAKFEIIGEPNDLESAKDLALNDRFQFQMWALSLINATPSAKKSADGGIDGFIHNSFLGTKYKGIVQVKSGGVSPSDIRDLNGTMKREKADYSIFITLEKPSRDMKIEALSEGYLDIKYGEENFGKMLKIQISTIEDLLNDRGPKMPAHPNNFNVASRGKREEKKFIQKSIDDID